MTFLFVLGNAIPNFLEHNKIGRRKRGSVSDYRATTLVACFASVTYTVWAVNDRIKNPGTRPMAQRDFLLTK